MTTYFDAHSHLQEYASTRELDAALEAAKAAGVKTVLCNGTSPADWERVSALAAGHKGIIPCFGLHPWFVGKVRPGWLGLLEGFLSRSPSCVGEIGLDKAASSDFAEQEESFRAQLRLAKKLERPVSIHCVRAWGRLLEVLKEERPPAFMLHAYGGPPEMTGELAGLGAYFSFSGAVLDPEREKMRKALLAAPPERLLFETESPGPALPGRRPGPQGVVEVIGAAAAALGQTPEALGTLSWRNAETFLGELFSQL